jgi:hypothetical protein
MLYVLFWSLLASAVFIHRNYAKVIAIVFLITCALEFLQLRTSPFLSFVRSTFAGRALIGSVFSWTDFIYYAIGAVSAMIINRSVVPSVSRKS